MGHDKEIEDRRNGGSSRPPALPSDATHDEIVGAINVLAKAADEQARELQLIRVSVQELGTAIGTFCARIEKALGSRALRP